MSENLTVNENAIVPAENTETVKENSLFDVTQLPVIEQRLQTVKADIENKVAGILALECTEETVKTIKKFRTDLKNDFNNFEVRRKAVKQKILEPYNDFETIYNECVKNVFNDADSELKDRINEVEDTIKARKQKEVETYFEEYCKSKNIDFVGFKDTGINVTLSASVKSLKEKVKSFIDGIESDLDLIYTQEHTEEILVEYRKTLKASAAITAVIERHKAIEAEKQRQEQTEQFKHEQQNAVERVNAAVAETAETIETAPLSPPKTAEADPIIRIKIGNTVIKARKSDCIILKNLLSNGRYEIEK